MKGYKPEVVLMPITAAFFFLGRFDGSALDGIVMVLAQQPFGTKQVVEFFDDFSRSNCFADVGDRIGFLDMEDDDRQEQALPWIVQGTKVDNSYIHC